jgi:hypothetical protein
MKAYRYVIAFDGGAAPNYQAPMTTLAICKPRIRAGAQVGDFVMAFSAARLSPEPHGVRWAGVVSEKMTFAEYWRDARFAGKKPSRSNVSDNIYKPVAGGMLWVENRVHGPEEAAHDLSGSHVLCFQESWKFESAAPILPEEFGLRMVGGRRGHRVSNIDATTWARLRSWLNKQTAVPDDAESNGRTCRPAPVRVDCSRPRKLPRCTQ